MKALRLVLWDQLSLDSASLEEADKDSDVILFCETKDECTSVLHHKKKLVFLLSAMRHFASTLIEEGYQVEYIKLDDPENTQSLLQEIIRHSQTLKVNKLVLTWPADYRVYQLFYELQQSLAIDVEILEDERFLSTRDEFKAFAKDKKSLRMEFFYREMRKKYYILMHDNAPEGGKWNYDAENRQFPKEQIPIPKPFQKRKDKITSDVMQLVADYFPDHIGNVENFFYAVTRKDALKVLNHFIHERLPRFGDYQDVMIQGEPWLFHSHISMYINVGLLRPMECIKAAEAAYYHSDVDLPAAEGFIRQILGWREFVRGIYWLKMPDYKSQNYLAAKRPVPDFYWDANTKMNCMKQCVSETIDNAYAHHIQRLMVLGNFALLAGLDPEQVNEWYLIVYADAHEWVEMPNVTGMILFADGGYLASKPYAASGAYINKMSDYCKNCQYNVKEKNGASACPFNYLYWNFLIKNYPLLKNNHRLAMVYKTLEKMSKDKIKLILDDSELFLNALIPYKAN